MYTIGQVSAMFNLPVSTLRYYDKEIQELQKTLSLLKFKCWYYETAMKDGNEDAINAMLPDKLPKNIQKLYDKGHD